MSHLHILIDVQGYQSESKFRGVGRSTYEMSRAIIKNAPTKRDIGRPDAFHSPVGKHFSVYAKFFLDVLWSEEFLIK